MPSRRQRRWQFHGSRGRRIIRAGRSASSCPLRPAALPTSPRGLRPRSSAKSSGSASSIENQPGPGGIAAARTVLTAAPDGYTLGLVTNGTSISVAIYNALPFDPVKDFSHHLDARLFRSHLRQQLGVAIQDLGRFHQGGTRAARQAQRRHHQCRRHPESWRRAVQIVGRTELPDHSLSRHAGNPRRAPAQRRAAHGRFLRSDERHAG